MKKTLATALGFLALLASEPAMAGGLSVSKDLCLARTYSVDHLVKHPDQLVTYMRLAHLPSRYNDDQLRTATGDGGQYPASFLAFITVRFKDRSDPYQQSVYCSVEGSGYRCGVECDGGAFSLRFKQNGSALIDFRQTGGMVLNSSCGEGDDYRWLGDGKSDDMLFRLDPASRSVCK